MSHVDEGTLHAYLDGELAPVERERVDTHLKGCPACQARLAEERAVIERASRLLGMATPPERAMPPLQTLRQPPLTWRLRRPLAWAATLVLAIGLGWIAHGWMIQRTNSDEAAPEMVTVATPRVRASQPAAAPDTAGSVRPEAHLAMREPHWADSANKDRDQRQLADAQTAPAANNALQARESASVVTGAASGTSAEQKADAVAQLPRQGPSGVTVRRQAAAAPVAAEPAAPPPIIVDGVAMSGAASGVITTRGRRATPIMSTTWPIIARQPARDVLGVEPVLIPGFAVRAYRRNPEAREIAIEQVTDAGTTISLIERRVDTSLDELKRADSAAANAPNAPRVMAKAANERLARFVGPLRIEIDGPLTPDSLSSLLELAR